MADTFPVVEDGMESGRGMEIDGMSEEEVDRMLDEDPESFREFYI